MTSAATIARVLLEAHPGEVLRLTVERDSQSLEISITLEEMNMRF